MTTLPLIAADISNHNNPLTTAYTRDMVIFKATQGTYFLDDHFLNNAAVANRLHSVGRLPGGGACYHVYTNEPVTAQFRKIVSAIGPTPPPWLTAVMVDLETWRGTAYQLTGDHSVQVNQLLGLIANYMKSWRAAWQYANAGDMAELAPHRDRRAPMILAAYTSQLLYSNWYNCIGQQYTDGTTRFSVPVIGGVALPRWSTPEGSVDHNVFPAFRNGAALRAWARPAAPPQQPPPPRRTYYDIHTTRTDRLVSPNGRFAAEMQDNGQLVVRDQGKAIFYTKAA